MSHLSILHSSFKINNIAREWWKLGCPGGFVEEAGNCFRIPNFEGDFHSAKNVCVKMGAATGYRFKGQLAEIKNAIVFQFLYDLVIGNFNFEYN